jgi:hypothetical protein
MTTCPFAPILIVIPDEYNYIGATRKALGTTSPGGYPWHGQTGAFGEGVIRLEAEGVGASLRPPR